MQTITTQPASAGFFVPDVFDTSYICCAEPHRATRCETSCVCRAEPNVFTRDSYVAPGPGLSGSPRTTKLRPVVDVAPSLSIMFGNDFVLFG